jgi:flagellar protein FlgJ
LPAVAKQFESMFTQMMLKSMRDASFGDPLFESQAGDQWQDMFDQQLSLNLSQHGKGLGIADMLVRQLGGHNSAQAGDAQDAGVDPSMRRVWSTVGNSVCIALPTTLRVRRAAHRWRGCRPMPRNSCANSRRRPPSWRRNWACRLRTVLAQAALETQWGKHMPTHPDGTSSFNLFGIKAGGSWGGSRVNVPTVEYEGGIAVRKQAQFRAYQVHRRLAGRLRRPDHQATPVMRRRAATATTYWATHRL